MNFWHNIAKPIIGLSPMDGVTDASFRFITAKHGRPDVMFTEFVNVQAACFASHTLIKDLTYSEIERPIIAQIYGHMPELFYKVAHVVCELGFDGLDINMGCPAKKVANNGSGAGLIRTPELARSIIRAAGQGIQHWYEGQTLADLDMNPELIEKISDLNRLRTGLESAPLRRVIPLSIKTRIGFDRIIVEDWVETLLAEKPSAISIHGRTLQQQYKGNADWEAIARAVEVAKNSQTLILGNGDLKDMPDVYRRVRETNVDGVLLGRAAEGNPWIFRAKDQVKQALRNNDALDMRDSSIVLEERFKVLLEHSDHFEKYWGPSSFVGMRKHLTWYCRESRGAAELRTQMVRANKVSEVIECLKNYAKLNGSSFDPADHLG
jgi:tRNA-dihydrouridine synthase